MKRIVILGSVLALGTFGLVACTGDDEVDVPETDSGTGTDAAHDAGHDTGAVDANVPSDATVDAGGLDTSTPDTSTPDTSTPDTGATDAAKDVAADVGSSDASADASDAGPTYAIFVGSDFTKAELSVVALHPDSIGGRLALADQDSVAFASGGYGFVLEHGLGKAIVLDHTQPWIAHATVDINDSPDSGTYASNPRAVLVTTGTKAYVARYASNVVKVIDVGTGAATGSVDLSKYLASDDTDGTIDVQDAVYDPSTKRAYFLLQRIDQFDFSGSAPDYVAGCLASHGEIVGVDVTTDTFVDLNGAAAGEAIDLLGDNPASLFADFGGGRFIVAESGCHDTADAGPDAGTVARLGRGVESVAIATGAATWLYQTSDVDRLSGVLWIDGTHAYVNKGDSWFPWNPTQTTLGAAIVGFPDAPLHDGARVVGLRATQPDAGTDGGVTYSVIALDIATSQISTIVAAPFQSVVPSSPFGLSSALVH